MDNCHAALARWFVFPCGSDKQRAARAEGRAYKLTAWTQPDEKAFMTVTCVHFCEGHGPSA
eukprot:3503441-Pleurochrysis_carterae.AAC.1